MNTKYSRYYHLMKYKEALKAELALVEAETQELIDQLNKEIKE